MHNPDWNSIRNTYSEIKYVLQFNCDSITTIDVDAEMQDLIIWGRLFKPIDFVVSVFELGINLR